MFNLNIKLTQLSAKLKEQVLFYYLFTFFIGLMFFNAVSVPFFQNWGGLSFTQILFLQSWFSLWQFVLEVPTGAVADYLGRKTSLIMGAWTLAVAALMYSWVPLFSVFLVAELAFALGISLISGAGEALLYDSFKQLGQEDKAKKFLGQSHSVYLLGMMAASPMGAWIAVQLGLNMPMAFCAGSFFVAGVFGWKLWEAEGGVQVDDNESELAVQPKSTAQLELENPLEATSQPKLATRSELESQSESTAQPKPTNQSKSTTQPDQTTQSESTRYLEVLVEGGSYVWKHPQIRSEVLRGVLVAVSAYYIVWFKVVLLQQIGLSLTIIGWMVTLLMLFELILSNFFDEIDAWLVERGLNYSQLTAWIVVAAFVLVLIEINPVTVFFFVILGGGFGLTRMPYLIAQVSHHIPSEHRATVISSLSMLRRFFYVPLNPLVGWLADQNLRWGLLLSGVAVFVSLLSEIKSRQMRGGQYSATHG